VLDTYNKDNFEIEIKKDNSPLTEADKKSHSYIIRELKKYFPGVPVLSEEGADIKYEERKCWNEFFLVDPLDGTKEFINRDGDFTINIAIIKGQNPVFGVIHVPVTGETYYGSINTGSYKKLTGKTKKITVNDSKPTDGLTVVQSKSHSGEEENLFYSKFNIVDKMSRGSSLKICMVAEGKADIYFRGGPTWEWDTAAGHAILAAAGGYFINKDGTELLYNKKILKNSGFIACAFQPVADTVRRKFKSIKKDD
jgi:3'(2'), 5'-bisphosphate nucleotidase